MRVPPTQPRPSADASHSVAIVTRWPPAGMIHSGRGIASYSKQLALALSAAGWRITIVADYRPEEPKDYVESGIRVTRQWRSGLAACIDIPRVVKREEVSIVHVQHETFAFGRRLGALVPPILVGRLSRVAPVVTTVHGVIPPAEFNGPWTADYAGALPQRVVRAVYSSTLRGVIKNSSVIHVHDMEVLRSLNGYGSPRSWAVIPHGIPTAVTRVTRKKGLHQLGLREARRAVFFGFLLPYKGLDTLEAAAPQLNKYGIEVLLAGGESGDELPTHIRRHRQVDPIIKRLGFIPEHQLPALFAIADVMVFPHRVGLSASGPMMFCLLYTSPSPRDLSTSRMPSSA